MRIALWIGLVLGVTAPAAALTPAEIDAVGGKAHSGLRTVVRKLASDKLLGRDNATQGSLDAQAWLLRKLRRLGPGLDAAGVGDGAYEQAFVQSGQPGTNLLAVIPGRELPNEYVIVGAHYDHLDSRSSIDGHCSANGTPGGSICNGATDNAAGVAAVLAIGQAIRRLPTPPRRSVVLALWDAEEDGLLGSRYYVNHPLVPNASVKGYVNFDIQGANLLPSLRTTSFAVSGETGGSALGALIDQAVATESLGTRQLTYLFGQLRSDYANFVGVGVPTVFFSDSTGGCYHTTGDDVSVVDFTKLKRQSHIAFRTTAGLAETATPPSFVPSGGPVYADAVVIADVVHASFGDLALFSSADQAFLQSADTQLQAVVAAGPGAFDQTAVSALIPLVVQLVDTLTHVACQRF
ncbi:MAG: M20/M25/M40 family metallo-hydrolase [Candidatus Binatia bacterium]